MNELMNILTTEAAPPLVPETVATTVALSTLVHATTSRHIQVRINDIEPSPPTGQEPDATTGPNGAALPPQEAACDPMVARVLALFGGAAPTTLTEVAPEEEADTTGPVADACHGVAPGHHETAETRAWRQYAPTMADWAITRLVVRTDVYGAYRRDGTTYTAHDPVTPELLVQHFRGDISIGLFPISSGLDNICKWVAADIDNHDGNADPETNFQAALMIADTLTRYDLNPLILDSNGKGGFHVRAFLHDPVSAAEAHWLGDLVKQRLQEQQLPPCEWFPKQPALSLFHPFGNWLRLPGKHPRRGVWTKLWFAGRWCEGEDFLQRLIQIKGDPTSTLCAAFKAQNPSTANPESQARDQTGADARRDGRTVSKGARRSQKRAHDPVDEATVQSALASLPAEYREVYQEGDDLRWIAVGMALHDWSPSLGLPLWHDFSRASPKYDPAVLDAKWATFTAGGGITVASIIKAAQENGWTWPQKDGDTRPDARQGGTLAAHAAIENQMQRAQADEEFKTGVPQGDESQLECANFAARIVYELTRHETGGLVKHYEIEARRKDPTSQLVTKTIRVPAAEYAQMKWPETLLGAAWIVKSGRTARDKLRERIQRDSDGWTKYREIHTTLGWTNNIYVHAKGAIGPDGTIPGFEVDCEGLSLHELPDPPFGEALRTAITARHQVQKLSYGRATPLAAILLALPARAVLGPTNFITHLGGTSGVRKTSLGLVAAGSFGIVPERGMERGDASWNSTVNNLQLMTHHRGDGILVIDELTGEEAIRNATIITQAQGNLRGRGRMNRGLGFAARLDPRCTALSTGEADPSRNSALGRMLLVPVTPADLNLDTLTKVQNDIQKGIHRAATAAYVQWLATNDRIGRIRDELPRTVDKLAKDLLQEFQDYRGHDRTPRALAELLAGCRIWLTFAQDQKAITPGEAQDLETFVHDGLTTLLSTQAQTHQESTPGTLFLNLLRSGLISGRYHLADIKNTIPTVCPAAFGWRQGTPNFEVPPGSIQLGFVDGEAGRVYLDPQLAKELARQKGQAGGTAYENPNALGRDLHAEGFLITETENEGKTVRYTCQKWTKGIKQRYLVIPLAVFRGE